MLQVAIIGLGSFGIRMLEELNKIEAELIIVDKNRDIVDVYKDYVRDAYVSDVINKKTLQSIIPGEIDAAVVDLGGKIEAAIMTVVHLKKIGVERIIAKARSDEQLEVFKMVGASDVVLPDQIAAQRIVPMVASKVMFNYLHISPELSLAEVKVVPEMFGKTLAESGMREKYKLNIVGYRENADESLKMVTAADFHFDSEIILLVAGTEEDLKAYSCLKGNEPPLHKDGGTFFEGLFKRH